MCVCVCVCVYIYRHTHTYELHTYIHAYIQTNTHTYTHIQAATDRGAEEGEGETGINGRLQEGGEAVTGTRHSVAHAWAPRSPSAAAVAAAEGLAFSAGRHAKKERMGAGGGGGGDGGGSAIRIDEEVSSQVM